MKTENQTRKPSYGPKPQLQVLAAEPDPTYVTVIQKPEIDLELIVLDGSKRIALHCDQQEDLMECIRKIPGCRWSRNLACWHVPASDQVRQKLRQELGRRYHMNWKSSSVPGSERTLHLVFPDKAM